MACSSCRKTQEKLAKAIERMEGKLDAILEALSEEAQGDAPIVEHTLDGAEIPVAYPDMRRLLDGTPLD